MKLRCLQYKIFLCNRTYETMIFNVHQISKTIIIIFSIRVVRNDFFGIPIYFT